MSRTHTKPVSSEASTYPDRYLKNISVNRIPVFVAFFFIADIALLSFYIVNQVVGTPFDTLTRLLDLNGETSLSNWYSVIQLACVAALTGLFAFRNVRTGQIRTWPLLLLPLIFITLSIDESVSIHEWLGEKSDALLPGNSRENTLFTETGIWMFLVGIPFFAGFLGIIYILRRYFRTVPGVLPKFLMGLAIMATGATLIEILSNFVKYDSAWYHLELVCEEGCEMLGVTIILWAIYDLLLGHGLYIHLDPVDEQWS
jgi:hypothetical protein